MFVRRRPLLLILGTALVGFVLVGAMQARPDPRFARRPPQYRLARLIDERQATVGRNRSVVKELRKEVSKLAGDTDKRLGGAGQQAKDLRRLGLVAGLEPAAGPGLVVTLRDSTLDDSPSGNVNDLVVHSADVQAVVNALWRSGATAISINGQRLVSTSAVLCVGNTLLLNGTVHSPPYTISTVDADDSRFESDRLVQRLHDDSNAFQLGFDVEERNEVKVPGFSGSTTVKFAAPA